MPPIHSVSYKRFICFLRKNGLVLIRVKASHEYWDYPTKPHLLRAVSVRPKDKNIPVKHIMTSLNNMGISNDEFFKQIKDC